jgi:DNA invertase Pin-like site-specific DNA recombinase
MSYCYTTPEIRQRIAETRERGMSYRAIQMKIGTSVSTIRNWCLIQGAEPPGEPRQPSNPPQRPVMRNGREVRPFMPEEDALAKAMALQGSGYSEIARHMAKQWPDRPRQPATIKYRLLTLARHEARLEGAPAAQAYPAPLARPAAP